MGRFVELEHLTLAIQDYVRDRFRHTIAPTAIQIEQYVRRHPELEKRLKELSDQGREEVRALISRQLEFQNSLASYERFVQEFRSDVEIIQVIDPEEL